MSNDKKVNTNDITISIAPNGFILTEVHFDRSRMSDVLGVFNQVDDLNAFIKSHLQATVPPQGDD